MRVTESGVLVGTALAADEMRARAETSARGRDLAPALQRFYDSSLALSLTLDLEPTATLAPSEPELSLMPLVRNDLPIEDLLVVAIERCDDLQDLRALIEAAVAERKSLGWSSFGPHLQAGYQFGGIAGNAEDVIADQSSRARADLAEQARVRLGFAEEFLRLTRANLQAGTMTQLDVLHAPGMLAQARLRYAGAVVGHDQAQVELLAALGMLDADGLLLDLAGTTQRE